MRNKLIASAAVLVTAFLLVTNPVVADAARLITGGDIKNNTITSKDIKDGSLKGVDIKESTLATVPAANNLTPLPSGQSQSGAFSAAAGDSGAGGWLGFEINYARPLSSPIANGNIIDTVKTPDAAHCPGPGHAAPGYLCLYSNARNGVDYLYGYSDSGPYAQTAKSVGVGLYAVVNGATPYVDGIWTVTAP
jgi:hypothetical protein